MIRFKTAAAMSALCAAQVVALGACADMTPPPQYPVSAPAPAPVPVAPAPAPAPVAPPPAPDDDTPKAAPTAPVGSSALPATPGAKVAPPKSKPSARLEPRYETASFYLFAASSDGASVTVGKGDTLAKIAKKVGVSIDDLAKANKIEPPYTLKLGQTLTVPGKAPEPTVAPEKPSKAAKGKGKAAAKPEPKPPETVTVGKGDTLAKIAKKAGVSIDDLAKANNLSAPYRLKQGQTLVLSGDGAASDEPAASSAPASKPEKASKADKPPAPASVKVGKGQTLQSIADKAGVPVAELAKLNHLKKPYRVKRGQVIKLPADESDTAPAPSLSLRGEKSHGGAVQKAAPPKVVTAGRHDTLQTIADKAGVPVAELAKLNHLKKPYKIKRGQKIKVPGHAAPEAAAPSAPASYQVQKGDTLYSIARKFSTTPQALADANGLDLGAHVKVGRRLQLPGGPLDRPAPPATASRAPSREPGQPVPYSTLPANPGAAPITPGVGPSTAPPSSSLTEKLTPYTRPNSLPPPAATSATPPGGSSDAEVSAAGRGFFQWPVRGRLLAGFGPSAAGQRNAGMDLAAPANTPVMAAAAGEVVYSGNSVPGYGNLVLIRHEGGWVTAYAHLANLDVKMRQTVAQGQQIGQVGTTGGVDQPQLHFEVRYAPNVKDAARPIDPMLVLPPQ
jgi:murein DD-endopeptidase MepM/ murein hydrolase activator NlpD